MSNTAPALQLDLPGASGEAYQVPGVPGLYRADRPTPVGGPGEVSAERARELDADPGMPLKLVRVKKSELDETRAAHQADVRAAARQLDPADVGGVDDQEAAAAADPVTGTPVEQTTPTSDQADPPAEEA